MIGVVVAAHGNLAAALAATAREVIGEVGHMAAVGINPSDDTATYEQQLHLAIEEVSDGSGVLLLTDMFGGTPSNVGMTLHSRGTVEVLTGVNLPMVIKALQVSQQALPLAEVARQVRMAGQRSIAVAGDLLSAAKPSDEQDKGGKAP